MANWRKLALLPAAVTALGGCRLDMHVQPRQNPLSRSDFFPDQRAARPLLEGTVAREQYDGDTYLHTGKLGNNPGDYMPFSVTKADLERGRVQYNIFCAPCHSRVGDGNGYIPSRGFARKPPSFHIERLEKAPLGYIFGVITEGFGIMPDYASQTPEDTRCLRRRPSLSCREQVRPCRRLSRRVPSLRGRNRNEHHARPSGPLGAPGRELDWPPLAGHRRSGFGRRGHPRPDESDRVPARLPDLLHGLAERLPGSDGDPDDSPPDGRRLGHGDPAHPGRGHAHSTADGGPVPAYRLFRGAPPVPVGHAAGVRAGSQGPRTPAGGCICALLPESWRLLCAGAGLFRDLGNPGVSAEQVVGGTEQASGARQQRALQSGERAGADPVCLHRVVCRYRLGDVTGPHLDFDDLWLAVCRRRSDRGALFRGRDRAYSVPLQADVSAPAARLRA